MKIEGKIPALLTENNFRLVNLSSFVQEDRRRTVRTGLQKEPWLVGQITVNDVMRQLFVGQPNASTLVKRRKITFVRDSPTV